MSTQDTLIELINEANPNTPPLDLTEVELIDPIDTSGDVSNTELTVHAIPGSGYVGDVSIQYNRVNQSVLEPVNGIQSETPFTPESVIATLVASAKMPLDATDIEPFTVPDMQVGDIFTTTLEASSTSLGWNGSVDVALLYGLPPNSDDLYNLMNFSLPANV